MSNKRDLTIFERVVLELAWVGCYIIGHLPHYMQFYMLAPAMRFIIYRVLKYRVKVVDANLRNSFPERSDEERTLIRDQFYTYISEVFISTLALTNRRRAIDIITNLDPTKPSNLEKFRDKVQDRSWVALSAHYGLWEYQMFWATYSDRPLIGVYHPLRDKISDVLFKRLRDHHKVVTLPSKETLRFAIRNGQKYQGESYGMGLLADQSPPLKPNSRWRTFLNQETAFYDGGEKMALHIGMPVYFIYQRRITPGRYELCSKLVWDGVESVEPNEITNRYVIALEETICETPYLWLWTHKRWKRDRSHIEKTEWAKNQKEA